MKLFFKILIVIFLLAGCRKDEVLMTGSITGRMRIVDQTRTFLSDHSGIEVSLMQENSLVTSDITDVSGGYLFENVPYGKYRIFLSKEKYIQAWNPHPFNHVGGYGATYIDQNIYEVPTYELTLDSISYYYLYEPAYIIHLKVNGDTTMPGNPAGYPFIVFAGTTDDVSRDNFTSIGHGRLRDYMGYYPSQGLPKVAVHGYLSFNDMSPLIQNVFTDTVWLGIYPLANGQNYPVLRFYPEALGKPSNIIKFVLDDLTGK